MIRIIALTDKGHDFAKKLQCELGDCDISFKPKPFTHVVQTFFQKGEPILFIGATGIAIRTLAPVLRDKHRDPPVVVIDENQRFVIPLLSGHEGGANEWARIIAKKIDGQLVLTTARSYIDPLYTIGMGCERGCPATVLEDLLLHCLDKANLSINQIKCICSIDIKANEVGLIELTRSLRKPFQTFDKTQLRQVEPWLSERSDYVFDTVGVYGVAESAALLSAQLVTESQPELLVNKVKNEKATCAIARAFFQ